MPIETNKSASNNSTLYQELSNIGYECEMLILKSGLPDEKKQQLIRRVSDLRYNFNFDIPFEELDENIFLTRISETRKIIEQLQAAANRINQYPLHKRPGFLESIYAEALKDIQNLEKLQDALMVLESTKTDPRCNFQPHIDRLKILISLMRDDRLIRRTICNSDNEKEEKLELVQQAISHVMGWNQV